MRTKEIKRQAATFRGKGHVACFSSQSLHAQLTDNGVAAESTKGQGAAKPSEGETVSLAARFPTRPPCDSFLPAHPGWLFFTFLTN